MLMIFNNQFHLEKEVGNEDCFAWCKEITSSLAHQLDEKVSTKLKLLFHRESFAEWWNKIVDFELNEKNLSGK